jgi:uncharacterized membrane protein
MDKQNMNELLSESKDHLEKLHKIVDSTIEEERLIVENLLHPQQEIVSAGQGAADKIARFGGSWKFIIIFGIVIVVWVIFNVLTPAAAHFDPYPFILMNLVLSCIAALQAPVIMMSQNRQEEKDRMRGENDYLINLKAEMEIRSLHKKMDLLIEKELKTLFETQARQFSMLEDIMKRFEKHGGGPGAK